MRVLVTGVSGFVGGAVHRRLLADPDREVLGVARTPLDRPQTQVLDLERPADLAALDWPADVVIHAAARVGPWGPTHRFHAQNVLATRHLLDWAARRPRPPRVVHVSTSSVHYTRHDQLGIREDDPLPRPLNAYVRTKAEAETLVRGYPGEWVVLRPRAVVGPGDTTLLPQVLAAAARGALPRVRRTPPAVGDLVDIDTLVTYLLRAAEHPDASGQVLAVTNGQPVDLQATLHRVLRDLGLPEPRRSVGRRTALAAAALTETVWRLARRPGEPPLTRFAVLLLTTSKTFDVSRCRALLGGPEVDLETSLRRLVAAHRETP